MGAPIWLTITDAEGQLRQTLAGTPDEAFVTWELQAAEAAIVTYLQKSQRGRDNVTAWTTTPTSLPADVRAAMLYRLGELDMYRGDTAMAIGPQRTPDRDLPDPVLGLLRHYTDPQLA